MKPLTTAMMGYHSEVRHEGLVLGPKTNKDGELLDKSAELNLQLSADAVLLQKLQTDLADIPVVDQARVNEARHKVLSKALDIQQSTTQKDAYLRIADRILDSTKAI